MLLLLYLRRKVPRLHPWLVHISGRHGDVDDSEKFLLTDGSAYAIATTRHCNSTNLWSKDNTEELPHLRRYEVCSVTRCEQEAVIPPQLLGEAEVADSDGVGVPRIVHVQNVTGLQVPMNHLCAGNVRSLTRVRNCFTVLKRQNDKAQRTAELLRGEYYISLCWTRIQSF